MANQSETKIDTIVKSVLVIFLCLFSFSIGTYVGNRFSNYQHQLSLIKGEVQTSELATKDLSLEAKNDEMELSATELEPMTSDDVANLAASMESAASENIDLSKKTETRDLASTETKPEIKDEIPNAPTAKTDPKAEPPAVKPAAVTPSQAIAKQVQDITQSFTGKYTVQIGAFPTETEAQKLTQDLQKKGLSAFFVTAKVADKKDESIVKTWYRVNVGLFGSEKEAEASKNELMTSKSISSGFVKKLTE